MSSIFQSRPDRGVSRVVVNQGAFGTIELAPAESGKKHSLVGGMASISADGTIRFRSGATDLCGPMDFPGKAGFVLPPDVEDPLIETAPGEALSLVSTGGAVRGVFKILTEEAR